MPRAEAFFAEYFDRNQLFFCIPALLQLTL